MTRCDRPLGRWINPGLGALILMSYLTSHPAVAQTSTPDWTAVAQVRLAAPVPGSLTSDKGGNITPYSTNLNSQTTRSMADFSHAALGTALAALWLMGGAWVGIRSARISTPLNQSADQMRNARRIRFI